MTRTCSVDGCERKHSARGYCGMHLKRWMKRGDVGGLEPERLNMKGHSTEVRFWAKVEKTDTCWLWLAHDNGLGYGQFWDPAAGRLVYAHRFSYELLIGPIPDGLTLDHLCRNPSCVNPDHLEPVTHRENVIRAAKAKTHCPQDHPYDEINTWLDKHGKRHCRTCNRDRSREYDRHRRAERRTAR